MRDATGKILYVGKAKNLKARVSSYFRGGGLASKTMAMVAKIGDIDITVTVTVEALLLEQNLIKDSRPPYNILLRDDKSYPTFTPTQSIPIRGYIIAVRSPSWRPKPSDHSLRGGSEIDANPIHLPNPAVQRAFSRIEVDPVCSIRSVTARLCWFCEP